MDGDLAAINRENISFAQVLDDAGKCFRFDRQPGGNNALGHVKAEGV